jgi:hypothetical protein
MTNEMVLQRTSNLVMPTHYIELDCEEMSYVYGGEIISLSELNADKNGWLAAGIIWSADAAAAAFIPFVGWAIALACTAVATLCYTSYGNACNAYNTVQHYIALGRSYTIYRYTSGGVSTYIVE